MYHYTKFLSGLKILASKKLWLVSSQEMDDISERFYGNLFATIALFKSDDEIAKEIRENLTEQEIIDINMKTFEYKFYSISFCDNCNNEYLWEEYADNNNGLAIEINENYLQNYFTKVIDDNYNKLNDDDIITYETFLYKRSVKYNYPIELFNDILNKLKTLLLRSNEKPDKNFYKLLFEISLKILAGVVKAKRYEPENEVRLLFQDTYSEEYIKMNPYYFLAKENNSKVLNILGLDQVQQSIKKHLELDISKIFNSDLIPSIVIGDKVTKENICKLREKLDSYDLQKTNIKDKNNSIIK